MLWQAIFEWSTIFLLIGLGMYILKILKNDKAIFLNDACDKHFQIFKFKIPKRWIEINSDNEEEILFKHIDERYEWSARIVWNKMHEEKDLIKLLKTKLTEKKIIFDVENNLAFSPIEILENKCELLHLEGPASINENERFYYVALILREKSSGNFIYAECKSSILNGLIEAPYFLEVIKRCELNFS